MIENGRQGLTCLFVEDILEAEATTTRNVSWARVREDFYSCNFSFTNNDVVAVVARVDLVRLCLRTAATSGFTVYPSDVV
jgi:hypothetical protein